MATKSPTSIGTGIVVSGVVIVMLGVLSSDNGAVPILVGLFVAMSGGAVLMKSRKSHCKPEIFTNN